MKTVQTCFNMGQHTLKQVINKTQTFNYFKTAHILSAPLGACCMQGEVWCVSQMGVCSS